MAEKVGFVVDSSVVAKWFLDEPDSDQAVAVRDDFAFGKVRLMVPTLLFYEVMNALRYSSVFSKEELVLASRSLSKYKFEAWKPRGRLLEASALLSAEKEVTIYDACYVALAQRFGSRVITEDRELLAKFPESTMTMAAPRG